MTYPPDPHSPYARRGQPPSPSPYAFPPAHETRETPTASDPYAPPPSSYGEQTYPVGSAPYGAPGPGQPDGQGERRRIRGWHVAVAGVLALVVGLGVGLAASSGGEVAELQAEVERLEGEGTALYDALTRTEEELAATEAEAQRAREELAAATEAAETGASEDETAAGDDETAEGSDPETADGDQADGDQADGEHTAGDYAFTDVQVGEDFIGGFEVRTRMTNTGPGRSSVVITATLLADGSVVGTATGITVDLAAAETITLEMFSLDAYSDWDEIEFQVDMEL